MPFFEAPSKPLPAGYPLPAIDAEGKPIDTGRHVTIPAMPAWLTHDLPDDEVARLKRMQGRVLPILEIDAYGYLWFGEADPWFSLRPDEVIGVSGTGDVTQR